MFLTKEELQALTKALQPKRMIKWLKSEGFTFRVGLDGYPVVLWEHVRHMLGAETPRARRKPQVNLSWQQPSTSAM